MGNCNTDRAQQSCRCGVGHELSQTAGQDEQYTGYNQRRRSATHQANSPFSDEFTSAGFIHSGGYRHHASEQEDGYPVDGSISLSFSQAAGQYAQQSADDSSHFKGYARDTNSHYQDYAQQDNAGNHLFRSGNFVSFYFLLDFLVSIELFVREQIFSQEHHVEHTSDRDRNTDPSEFEETERLDTSSIHCTYCNDVRRGTYHGDDTAPTASECQRH